MLLTTNVTLYFDYPLEQGLRHSRSFVVDSYASEYFDYPLEQGLRRITHILLAIFYSVF